MHTSIRTLIAMVMGVIVAIALGACGQEAPESPARSVVIVAGSTMNEPIVTGENYRAYLTGLGEGSVIGVVTDEGVPRQLMRTVLRDLPQEQLTRDDEIQAAVNEAVSVATNDAVATTEGTNQFEAMRLAAEVMRDAPGPRTIIFASSMIQTAGRFPMQHGALALDPSEVVGAIQSIPDRPALDGTEVVVTGLGQVQGTQGTVSAGNRELIRAFWSEVASALNARVTFTGSASGQPRTSAVKPVPEVSFQEERAVTPSADADPCTGEVTTESLDFQPDLATFRDPVRAEQVISEVAEGLRSCQGKVLIRCTTTSAVGTDHGVGLAGRRARAVAEPLADAMGLEASAITAQGLGYDPESGTVIPDRRADGSLDPQKAQRNRRCLVDVVPVP